MKGSMRPQKSTPSHETSETKPMILAAAGVSSPGPSVTSFRATVRLEDERIDAGGGEEPHLQPPRRIVHVLLRVSDQEDQAGDEIEQEADERTRHEVAHGGDRDVPKETHQAHVEEADDAEDERQADEVERLGCRPDPQLRHDLL